MAAPAPASWYRRGVVWLVAGLGVGLSFLTWQYAARSEAERIHDGFLSRAQTQATVAAQRLHEYEEMVYTLRDTFLGQQDVSRSEFNQVAQAILQRHQGVQALQWIQIIPGEDRTAFERRASRELGRPFVIHRRQPDGSSQPAPTDREYWVMTYVQPLAGNEPVLGYDVQSAPTAPFLTMARTTGQFQVSPVFHLLQDQDTSDAQGIVFILPFERTNAQPGAIAGFVQGVFRVQVMLAQSQQLSTNDALDCYYLDTTVTDAPTLIAAYLAGKQPATDLQPPPLDDPADYHEILKIGQRRWLLVIRPNDAWMRNVSSRQPALILAFGLACTALLASFVHSLLQRTARIESKVRERTRELHASEARLQDIVDRSPAIIFLKDPNGRYLLCNQVFADSCGHGRADILGRTDADLYGAEAAEQFRQQDTAVLAARQAMEFEVASTNIKRPGIYLTQKFPLLDEQGRTYALCGIATNISDRKLAEEKRLNFERKLLESQKLESLGVLAGGVAHDFNNILTTVLGNASLASLDLPPDHPVRKNLLQIERAATRAGDLCSQLLAYAGHSSFHYEPVNIAALVQDTAALLEVSVGKRARLDLQPEPSLPAVQGDATQLRQIVMNLVINAADAMGERSDGHIIVRTFARDLTPDFLHGAVQAPDLAAGLYVGLEVRDNGNGMPAAVLARIFEPFYTTKFSGRGLGLAAVLGIIQSHGGALFVESTEGKGTTFRLFLPATATPATESTPPMPLSTAAMHGTVLIVDDEESVRSLTQRALAMMGLNALAAMDGPSAVKLLQTHPDPIDLVLLDLTMPGWSGDETLRQLRLLRPDLCVVIMSGYSEGETRQRCTALGVAGFLAKPFDLASLLDQVRPHLG